MLLVLLVFAFAFAAQAVRMVSMDEAIWAALGWADQHKAETGWQRLRVGRVEPRLTEATNRYYVVEMEGEGAVFMSANTWMTPVVVCTNGSDFAALASDADIASVVSAAIDAEAARAAAYEAKTLSQKEIWAWEADADEREGEWTDDIGSGVNRDVITPAATSDDSSFDDLFTAEATKVVLSGKGTLSKAIEVTHDLTIVGEAGATVLPLSTAGFRVTNGARLCVSNVVFNGYQVVNITPDRYKGAGLFVVEDGTLTLGAGVELYNLQGASGCSGAVAVKGGAAEIGEGVRIESCRAIRPVGALSTVITPNGGGVTVSEGARLVMCGGTIVNCHAEASGGGVYVDKGSAVEFGGNVRIFGNGNEKPDDENRPYIPDDVHVYATSVGNALGQVRIATGGLGDALIGYNASIATLNQLGNVFFDVTNLTSNRAERAARCFVNDTYPQEYDGELEADEVNREVMAVYDPATKRLNWEWWEWREPLPEEPPEEPVIPDEDPYTMSLIALR